MIKPLVSVIITTYKGNNNLLRAINSVFAQTYKNIEIIVVDDNDPNSDSRKWTEINLEKYLYDKRFKYIKHEKNKNGSAARNTGIKNSRGYFISFLDDDDIFLPDKIEKCVEYLELHKEKHGVYTSIIFMKGKSYYYVKKAYLSNNYQRDLLLDNNLLGTGSNIFVKKECLKKLKGFDEEFLRFQDVEFMVRFLDYYNLGYIEEILTIKDSGDLIRRPDFNKINLMIKLFYNKFNNTISKLSKQEQDIINVNFNKTLYYAAVNSKSKEHIKNVEAELKRNNGFGIKEYAYKNRFLNYFINNYKRPNVLPKYKNVISKNNYEILKDIIY